MILTENESIVKTALQAIYSELGINEEVTSETIIYGPDQGINSLSLVRLIVDLEELVLEATGKNIVLADSRSLSMTNSPFFTVSTLTAYISILLNEQ
jgi:acyl carrier protein